MNNNNIAKEILSNFSSSSYLWQKFDPNASISVCQYDKVRFVCFCVSFCFWFFWFTFFRWINHQKSLIPSTVHALTLSFVSIGGILGYFSFSVLSFFHIFSLAYLQCSIFIELPTMESIEVRHHIGTSVFILIPFLFKTACSPWIIWLVNLGFILETTTPLLNYLISKGYLEKMKIFQKEREQNRVTVDFSLNELLFYALFLFSFILLRGFFPFWVLVEIGSWLWIMLSSIDWRTWIDFPWINAGDADFQWTLIYFGFWIFFVILQWGYISRLCEYWKCITESKRD